MSRNLSKMLFYLIFTSKICHFVQNEVLTGPLALNCQIWPYDCFKSKNLFGHDQAHAKACPKCKDFFCSGQCSICQSSKLGLEGPFSGQIFRVSPRLDFFETCPKGYLWLVLQYKRLKKIPFFNSREIWFFENCHFCTKMVHSGAQVKEKTLLQKCWFWQAVTIGQCLDASWDILPHWGCWGYRGHQG